jgi:signal peptidase I
MSRIGSSKAEERKTAPSASLPPIRRILRGAKGLIREARHLLKKRGKAVAPADTEATRTATDALEAMLPKRRAAPGDHEKLHQGTTNLDRLLTDHFGRWRKSTIREYVESILWAVALALVIRALIFEAFSIPSGSMMPTLQIGDHLFVTKINYGAYVPFSSSRFIHWSEPTRGDIIVFEYRNPGEDHDGDDFIKRIVAIPGDRIRLVNNVIHLNGKPIPTRVIDDKAKCPIYGPDNADEPSGHCNCVQQEETLGAGDAPDKWTTKFISQHLKGGCQGVHGRDLGDAHPNWSLSRTHRQWRNQQEPRYRDFSAFIGERIYWEGFVPMECKDPDRNPELKLGVPGCQPYDGRTDLTIPDGHVFAMGDNRDRSKDGRFWGLVPYDRIKGTAFVIWWARERGRIGSWL